MYQPPEYILTKEGLAEPYVPPFPSRYAYYWYKEPTRWIGVYYPLFEEGDEI